MDDADGGWFGIANELILITTGSGVISDFFVETLHRMQRAARLEAIDKFYIHVPKVNG